MNDETSWSFTKVTLSRNVKDKSQRSKSSILNGIHQRSIIIRLVVVRGVFTSLVVRWDFKNLTETSRTLYTKALQNFIRDLKPPNPFSKPLLASISNQNIVISHKTSPQIFSKSNLEIQYWLLPFTVAQRKNLNQTSKVVVNKCKSPCDKNSETHPRHLYKIPSKITIIIIRSIEYFEKRFQIFHWAFQESN
jgi:hypothetical protein